MVRLSVSISGDEICNISIWFDLLVGWVLLCWFSCACVLIYSSGRWNGYMLYVDNWWRDVNVVPHQISLCVWLHQWTLRKLCLPPLLATYKLGIALPFIFSFLKQLLHLRHHWIHSHLLHLLIVSGNSFASHGRISGSSFNIKTCWKYWLLHISKSLLNHRT